VRQAGAPRDGHDGHLRRFVVVLHALLRPDQRRPHGRRRHRLLDADGPVHRRHRARDPAPAVRALLDQGDARPQADQVQRTVQEPADARHGAQGRLLPQAGRRRQELLLGARPRRRARRARQRGLGPAEGRHAGHLRDDHDVEVQEQRRRPAGPDRPLRRRHRAPVRDVRLAAGADAGVERLGRRGRAPLPQARVGLRREEHRDDQGRGRRRRGPRSVRRRQGPAPRTCSSSRSPTTTSACSTTPSSPAR